MNLGNSKVFNLSFLKGWRHSSVVGYLLKEKGQKEGWNRLTCKVLGELDVAHVNPWWGLLGNSWNHYCLVPKPASLYWDGLSLPLEVLEKTNMSQWPAEIGFFPSSTQETKLTNLQKAMSRVSVLGFSSQKGGTEDWCYYLHPKRANKHSIN